MRATTRSTSVKPGMCYYRKIEPIPSIIKSHNANRKPNPQFDKMHAQHGNIISHWNWNQIQETMLTESTSLDKL